MAAVKDGLLLRCDRESWVFCAFPAPSADGKRELTLPRMPDGHVIAAVVLPKEGEAPGWVLVRESTDEEGVPPPWQRRSSEPAGFESIDVDPVSDPEIVGHVRFRADTRGGHCLLATYERVPIMVLLGNRAPIRRLVQEPRFTHFFGGIEVTETDVQGMDFGELALMYGNRPPEIMIGVDLPGVSSSLPQTFAVMGFSSTSLRLRELSPELKLS
jgi:hypothetical protein